MLSFTNPNPVASIRTGVRVPLVSLEPAIVPDYKSAPILSAPLGHGAPDALCKSVPTAS